MRIGCAARFRAIDLRGMSTMILEVDNLKCGGCANTIQKALFELPGVMGVTVDHDTDRVKVEHDGTLEQLVASETLRRLGYPERGTSTVLQAARSYVSCVIGRMTPALEEAGK